MRYRIGIFNTEFMDECVKTALEPLEDRCEFTTFYYKESGEIPEIYGRIEKDFDGFLVNGLISMAILNRVNPVRRKPVEAIHMDLLSYYRGILKLAVSKACGDLAKTYVDFLEGDSLQKRIEDGTVDILADRYCKKIEKMSLEELLIQKDILAGHVKKGWRDGNVELVITRFSTVVDELQKEGIPCYFIFPGKTYIAEVAGRLLMRIDMERMRDSFPAVIWISREKREVNYDELSDLCLQRALLEFGRKYSCDFIVQKRGNIFEALTSAGVLDRITGHATVCPLKDFLEKEVDGAVCIGYGIGKNVVQARQGALDSNREAESNSAGSSFLMDEQEHLIGPLSAGERLVLNSRPTGEHRRMAEHTGISPLTLQKICAVAEMEEDKIVTAQLLADRLGLTVRATSKYLQKLVAGGEARIAGTRQRKTRGRPELLVQIKAPVRGTGYSEKNDAPTEETV